MASHISGNSYPFSDQNSLISIPYRRLYCQTIYPSQWYIATYVYMCICEYLPGFWFKWSVVNLIIAKFISCFRANGLKKQLELFVSQHSGLEKIVAAKALQQFFGDNKKWWQEIIIIIFILLILIIIVELVCV